MLAIITHEPFTSDKCGELLDRLGNAHKLVKVRSTVPRGQRERAPTAAMISPPSYPPPAIAPDFILSPHLDRIEEQLQHRLLARANSSNSRAACGRSLKRWMRAGRSVGFGPTQDLSRHRGLNPTLRRMAMASTSRSDLFRDHHGDGVSVFRRAGRRYGRSQGTLGGILHSTMSATARSR